MTSKHNNGWRGGMRPWTRRHGLRDGAPNPGTNRAPSGVRLKGGGFFGRRQNIAGFIDPYGHHSTQPSEQKEDNFRLLAGQQLVSQPHNYQGSIETHPQLDRILQQHHYKLQYVFFSKSHSRHQFSTGSDGDILMTEFARNFAVHHATAVTTAYIDALVNSRLQREERGNLLCTRNKLPRSMHLFFVGDQQSASVLLDEGIVERILQKLQHLQAEDQEGTQKGALHSAVVSFFDHVYSRVVNRVSMIQASSKKKSSTPAVPPLLASAVKIVEEPPMDTLLLQFRIGWKLQLDPPPSLRLFPLSSKSSSLFSSVSHTIEDVNQFSAQTGAAIESEQYCNIKAAEEAEEDVNSIRESDWQYHVYDRSHSLSVRQALRRAMRQSDARSHFSDRVGHAHRVVPVTVLCPYCPPTTRILKERQKMGFLPVAWFDDSARKTRDERTSEKKKQEEYSSLSALVQPEMSNTEPPVRVLKDLSVLLGDAEPTTNALIQAVYDEADSAEAIINDGTEVTTRKVVKALEVERARQAEEAALSTYVSTFGCSPKSKKTMRMSRRGNQAQTTTDIDDIPVPQEVPPLPWYDQEPEWVDASLLGPKRHVYNAPPRPKPPDVIRAL